MTFETRFADREDLEVMIDLAEQEAADCADDADRYASDARVLREIVERRGNRG